jgi:hypothetical protein
MSVRLSISTPPRTAATITQASQAGRRFVWPALWPGRCRSSLADSAAPWPGCSRTASPGARPGLGVKGREATCVRLRCDHFFCRCRRAAAAIAAAATITSSVHRVSRPKMTRATPLSTRAATAFRPGPRKCRRTAGCRGGSLVLMSFTSTNTASNCLSFTLLVGRRGARVPAAKGPGCRYRATGQPGPGSAVLRGRHAVAADQLRGRQLSGVTTSKARRPGTRGSGVPGRRAGGQPIRIPGAFNSAPAAIRSGRRSREQAAPARRTQRCGLG